MMKAVTYINKKFEIGMVEKPKPGPKDALLKTLVACPYHAYTEGNLFTHPVIGTEGIGQIVEIGSDVKDFKVGDICTFGFSTPEWDSLEAQAGYAQHEHGRLGGNRMGRKTPGNFGEFFCVNNADANLALIPEGVSLKQACLVSDTMTTGFYASELAEIEPGDIVVVIGIGIVGLNTVQACAIRGASQIIAVGSRQINAQKALEAGATCVISYKEGDIVEQVLKLTNGRGADRAIVTGGPSSCVAQALSMVRIGGQIAITQIMAADTVIPFGAWGGGLENKTIKAGCVPSGRYKLEKMVRLLQFGRAHPERFITHEFKGFEGLIQACALVEENPPDLIRPMVYLAEGN